jgi:hypothetical protein
MKYLLKCTGRSEISKRNNCSEKQDRAETQSTEAVFVLRTFAELENMHFSLHGIANFSS